MAKKKEDNPRARNFFIELYPDNSEHMAVFDKLNKSYNTVGILHNCDVYEKERKNEAGEIVNGIGELKKEHYHIIVAFDNQRYLNGVAKEIGLEKRFIQKVDSFKKVARYLIHLDNEEKYQYNIDDVFGTPDMIAKVKKCCAEEQSLSNIAFELIHIIDSTDDYISEGQLFRIICTLGYCCYYNRLQRGLHGVLYDHNEKYRKGYKPDLKLCTRDFEEIV